jgi:hypothetical protein
MIYGQAYLTNKGAELASKTLQSKALKFSKFVIGSGDIATDSIDNIKSLTDAINPVFDMAITNIMEEQKNQLTVSGLFKNTDIEESFYLKELGLYAIDLETNEEILFAYVNYGEKADFIDVSITEKEELYFDMIITVDNADNVVINIDYNTVYATEKQLYDHINKTINDENGVHGFRYFDETLQFYNEGTKEWIDIETGGSGIAPMNVINPKIKAGNGKVTISWGDPDDTMLDGQAICNWKGTKLVQKVGAYPENIKDGILLVDNQIRNAYAENGFEVNNLTNGTTYYFALFPYSDKKVVNQNEFNRLVATPQPYKIMTVEIDLSNSNPSTCCTYTDDAVDMIPKSLEWDEFFGHYPCLFKDGEEVGKLNPNNFAQFEDETTADITSGDAGDVMIAFPRRGLKINIVDNTLIVSMTDDPDNPDFKYYAHSRGEERRNKFYLGAYKGCVLSSKLRSLSGKLPAWEYAIDFFRKKAQFNGVGYEQSGFYQLVFRQAMYLLKYKNLDSQNSVGSGFTNWTISDIPSKTGTTNSFGMDYGETDAIKHVKLFGIEDFWGNLQEWIDGFILKEKDSSTLTLLTTTTGFNDSGTDYETEIEMTDSIGYMKKTVGTSETGFVASEAGGSTTTYFCDYVKVRCYNSTTTYVPSFGGNWDSKSDAGIFCLLADKPIGEAYASIGARLMFL